jgi:hypothetical protein
MVARLFDALFGCRHNRMSFPMTMPSTARPRRTQATSPVEAHVVCLDCGKEFAYDWEHMRRVEDAGEGAKPGGVLKEGVLTENKAT